MKKVLLVFLALCLCMGPFHALGAIGGSEGKVVFEDDFNTLQDGPFAASGYSVVNDAENGSVSVVTKEDDSKDKYVKSVDFSDKSIGISRKFPLQSKFFSIAVDMINEGPDLALGPWLTLGGGWPYANAVTFSGTSCNVWNGEKTVKVASVIQGQWYRVIMVLDTEKNSTDVYLDGVLVKEGAIHRKLADGKTHTGGIDSFSFITSSTKGKEKCSAGINNIKIYDGLPPKDAFVSAPKSANAITTPIQSPSPTTASVDTTLLGDKMIPKVLPAYGEALKALRTKIFDSVVLFLDTPATLVKGSYTNVDPDNNLVVPFTENDRTLVPVRFISQNFGAQVSWNESTQEVGIAQGNTKITLTIGSKVMKVGDKEVTLDTPANTYNGRTLIPLRALVEALGKKVLWDDRGLIAISSNDLSLTEAEKDILCLMFVNPNEQGAYGAHSNVMVSSRWYRSGPNEIQGDIGTLDMIKRFMATDNTWSYITKENQIKSIVNLGVSFQGTNNMIQGWNGKKGEGTPGSSLDYDGKPIVPPGFTWGSPSGCINNEAYVQTVLKLALEAVAAGATAFQHDDAGANYGLAGYAPCFCEHCMKGFTEFLKRSYTSDQIKEMGIDNFSDSFNLKTYCIEKGLKTKTQWDAEHIVKKSKIYLAFQAFNLESNRKYYARIRKTLSEAAKTDVTLMANEHAWWTNSLAIEQQIMRNSFDYGHAENYDNFNIRNLGGAGTFFAAVDAPIIMTQISKAKRADALRTGIATAYATGHFGLVPWDVFLSGTEPRHFGTIYEFGDTFSFIRENNFLFNQYELYSKVKVLVNWSDITGEENNRLKNFLFLLLKAGIPFEMAIVSYDDKYIIRNLSENIFDDASHIICYSSIEGLQEKDKKIINASSAIKMNKDNVKLDEIEQIKIEGSKDIYSKIRAKGQQKVIHLLNDATFIKQKNIKIKVPKSFVDATGDIYLYRPGRDAVSLKATVQDEFVEVSIDEMENWAILGFGTENKTTTFDIANEINAFNVGNPCAWGEAKGDFHSLSVSSKGLGIGTSTPLDTALSDQGTYVFNHIRAPYYNDFNVEAKVMADTGIHGIMLRESAASNSKMVSLTIQNGKAILSSRIETNGDVFEKQVGGEGNYLKLVKTNNMVSAYQSIDGINYTELAKINMTFQLATAGVFSAKGSANYENIKVGMLMSSLKKENISSLEFQQNGVDIKLGSPYYNPITAVINGQKVLVDSQMATFESSDPQIASVNKDGIVTGHTIGKVTITTKVKLADGEMVNTTDFSVVDKLILYKQDFENVSIPNDTMQVNNTGIKIENGKLFVKTNESGKTSDITIKFKPQNTNIAYEFDYSAKFGTDSLTTGSRVAYIDNMGISLTADAKGFAYFFGDSQKVIKPIEQGKTHKIKIVAKYSEAVVDIYIDNEKVVENGPFRGTAAPSGSIAFGGWRLGMDSVYEWDNLIISSVDA